MRATTDRAGDSGNLGSLATEITAIEGGGDRTLVKKGQKMITTQEAECHILMPSESDENTESLIKKVPPQSKLAVV